MSIESCSSIVDLVSRLWGCVAPHASYVCRLEENSDALRTAMDELTALRNDMLRNVADAEGHQMKRLDQVQWWFTVVEKMEGEAEKLIRDASQEIEKKCLGGCCPKNCKASNMLGKAVVEMLKEVADLKSRGNFTVVADKLPLALVDKRPTEPTVGLQSTFDEVWSYIEDEQVGIIGIYGVGGVGKSTLMAQINNKLLNTAHDQFEFVIWTVVSNNPSSIKVQEATGKKIGLADDTWKNKSHEESCRYLEGFKRKEIHVVIG